MLSLYLTEVKGAYLRCRFGPFFLFYFCC